MPARLASPAFLTALGVLVGGAAAMSAAISIAGLHLSKRPIQANSGRTLQSLPPETASWVRVSSDRIESNEIVEVLGTENYVSRLYREKNPAPGREPLLLDLHVSYYTGQIDTVPHVPERCFTGGGMHILSSARVVPLPLTMDMVAVRDVPEEWKGRMYSTRLSSDYGDGRGTRVNLPLDPRSMSIRVGAYGTTEGDRIWTGYFFIANGAHVASAEGVRLLAFNLTDDYAYYLKVQVTSGQVSSHEELAQAAGRLMDELLGEIMWCVPDWLLVQRGLYPEDNPRRLRKPS